MSERDDAFKSGKAKLPLGISSIDLANAGGYPPGSFVILFGGTGSGKEAFMQTSAFMSAAMKQESLPKPKGENIYLPENIVYVLLSKTKDDVIRDVNVGFSDELAEAFQEEVLFKDFMSDYYSSTLLSLESEEETPQEEEEDAIEIVRSINSFLDENGKNSLIIIDSLDDLIRAFPEGEERDLLASLRTVRSRNRKNWNSLILNRLTKNIFPNDVEESILSIADGVFKFESSTSGGSRERKLVCEKFSGVTAEELLNSTFEIQITNSGFEARRTTLLDI